VSFQVGDVVGDYRIIGVVGKGGMGRVFRVEHTITRRVEAIKVLLEGQSQEPDRARRFLREIQVQAKLSHPNIAAVYYAFTAGDDLVMVMELVEGETLEQILERGPIPLEQALGYTRQVLSALDHAHSQGVTHRDLKPANMIVTPEGTLKLTDFGLATGPSEAMRITDSGAPVGSAYYMSCEQVRGVERPDARTDIYSLGVVLYEMATGSKPFAGASSFEVMSKHVNEAPAPPSERAPGLPPHVNLAILRALEKDPARRFPSAREFRRALDETIDAAAPAPRRRWGIWAAAVVLAAMGLWMTTRPPKTTSPAEPPKPKVESLKPAPKAAEPSPPVRAVRVPAGARLRVRVDLTLSSDTQRAGESFTGRLEAPLVGEGKTVAPAGRLVEGRITASAPGGRFAGRSRIALQLVRLHLPGGKVIAIRTDPVELRGARAWPPLVRRARAATVTSQSILEFRLAESLVVDQ
jgi:serine/threonine-protein kinase